MLPAVLYFVICLGVVGFQLALIFGAPWGELTQGGRQTGVLNLRGRVIAAVSIFILLAMGCAVLFSAGIWPVWTGWIAIAVQALSTLANWATPSAPERKLWGPITTVMLGLAVGASLI